MACSWLGFIAGISIVYRWLKPVNSGPATRLFGLDFPNPVGLAAGFDKNAVMLKGMEMLGFGFVEIGTVTPKPQDGNPKPRIFRLPADEALINRMGFNNDGVEKIAERLKRVKKGIVVGGNIGKNKNTSNENAISDYLVCLGKLYDVVDYFVVNVSSPNTPHLRELQEKEPLQKLLSSLMQENIRLGKEKGIAPKPLLLKIAPDLTNGQLDDVLEVIKLTKLDGIIATNTTISRSGLKTDSSCIQSIGAGGLSGKPLGTRSTEIIRYISEKTDRKLPIIAAGGIHSADDAIEKIQAGASLIQIYTGFIYEGPALIGQICKRLSTQKSSPIS